MRATVRDNHSNILIVVSDRNGRHSLTLLNIDGSSVGDYQCVANNSEGVDASIVKLSGNNNCISSLCVE